MRARSHSLTILIAASYLLAVSAAGLFHDHGWTGCGPGADHAPRCSPLARDRSHPEPGCREGAGAESPDGTSSDRCPADGRHCPVCQFLAQKPAGLHVTCEVTFAEREEEAVSPAPLRLAAPRVLIWHSRAPPPVA